MNIIFVGRNHGKSKTYQLGNKQLIAVSMLFLLLIVAVLFSGYRLHAWVVGESDSGLDKALISVWQNDIASHKQEVSRIKQVAQEKVDALTLRMGDMQARLLRLDALGQRLTEVAKLKNGEFDFSASPALGGPTDVKLGESYKLPGIVESLDLLDRQLTDSEQQLEVIDALFVSRKTQEELFIAGRPIKWGWMSSAYGYRTDPFSGKRAWHAGVDFAGKEDSDIIAVCIRRGDLFRRPLRLRQSGRSESRWRFHNTLRSL